MIKWLCNRIYWAGRNYDDDRCVPVTAGRDSIVLDSDGNTPDMDKAIKFAVLPARGGCVMETRIYDRKEHTWDVTSHVIPEGTDVAEAVGKIVAMELLRR